MLKPYVYQFVQITHELESTLGLLATIIAGDAQLKRRDAPSYIRTDDNFNMPVVFANLDRCLSQAKELCIELNMTASLEHIGRFDDERPYREDRYNPIANLIRELRQRIEDELKQVQFVSVPPSKVEYYDTPSFGTKVETRFPSAIGDIREAGNCFALGRWTGVVHHCMGVVQVGLTALAEHLEISINTHVDDWNTIITKIEGAVIAKRKGATRTEATPEQKSRWRQVEPFYNEIISDVRAIKDAWRNPTAHFRRQDDESSSKKVLEKVGDFMRSLSENLG